MLTMVTMMSCHTAIYEDSYAGVLVDSFTFFLHVGAKSYAGSKFHSRDYDNGDDNADGDVDDNASGLKVLGLDDSGPKRKKLPHPTLVCTLDKKTC